MRFVCDSCRAQYMISDDKVGAKGVKVRCKKCGHDIVVRHVGAASAKEDGPGGETAGGTAASKDSSGDIGLSSSLGTPPEGGLFGGVEEDEIGAVFDQVLNTGSTKVPAAEVARAAAAEESAETVRKLAEAEAGSARPAAAHEWFVAIDEKQVGPLSMEKVKEHWDKGEVGPDSLCWRVGFGDWIPLSEATELASVLAPRPTRPVIVEPAPVASSSPAASGPVESAFSAGGLSSKKSETPAPMSGPSAQDSGWKPSAASVLASLVKEENEALSKPAPKASAVEEKVKPAASGLLDVLPPEPTAPSPMMAEPHAPAPQYMAPAPAPAYAPPPAQGYGPPMQQQYAPPQGYAPPPAYPGYPQAQPPPPQQGGGKMGMVIGGAVAAALLVGAGVFFAMRTPTPAPTPPSASQPVAAAPVTPPPTKAPEPTPTPAPTAVAQAGTTPVAGNPVQPASAAANPTPAVAATGTTPPTAVATAPTPTPQPAAKLPEPTRPEPQTVARVDPPERTGTKHAVSRGSVRGAPAEDREAAAPARPTKSSGGDKADDDFDELFGTKKGGGTKATPASAKSDVYIPPEPGGGGKGAAVDRLVQSDIMQVVVSNKPAILKCVADQKKKDPGISGKLVMRWTIQTSGRTTGVSCQTGEFRSTYMATCIGGLIRGWTFPKHRVQGEPIDFPFTF